MSTQFTRRDFADRGAQLAAQLFDLWILIESPSVLQLLDRKFLYIEGPVEGSLPKTRGRNNFLSRGEAPSPKLWRRGERVKLDLISLPSLAPRGNVNRLGNLISQVVRVTAASAPRRAPRGTRARWALGRRRSLSTLTS